MVMAAAANIAQLPVGAPATAQKRTINRRSIRSIVNLFGKPDVANDGN
jgi:hypothetical protein